MSDMFNSIVVQQFPLTYCIARLVSYANCLSSDFIVALGYIDRLQARYDQLQLTERNVHRGVLAALLAAVKFVDEKWYSNGHYTSIGAGVDVTTSG